MPSSPIYHTVQNTDEAKNVIRALIAEDLKDSSIDSNAFGLEIYDDSTGKMDWSEWYHEDGSDIMQLIDEEMEEESEGKISDIQLIHEGEDYIKVSYKDEDGIEQEAEITGGIAIQVIKTLGKALYKESFIKKD